MADLIASPAFWGSLTTLTFLEIILGIDNLLFISIAIQKLTGREHVIARRVGVWGAMVLRIAMLGAIFWIIQLDSSPLFTFPDGLAFFLGDDAHAREAFTEVTIKDIILFAGGLFLLWKGTQEIHSAVEGTGHEEAKAKASLGAVIVQLVVINTVFSLDSVITAIGMTDIIAAMVAAIVLSTIVMAIAAEPLASFLKSHATTKMLALSFILLVGVALVADGAGFHIPRGYLYFAIAFSLVVELLNIQMRKNKIAA